MGTMPKKQTSSRRPKFSPVVTTFAAPASAVNHDAVPSTPSRAKRSALPGHDRVAGLETQVEQLRRDNETLKDALRLLLNDPVM
jgi:hypothetical protein